MFYVERRNDRKQTRFRPGAFVGALSIIGVLFLSGCNRPLPNPESLDPVYADLLSESSRAAKEVTEAQANLAEKMKTDEKTDFHDPTRRHTRQVILTDRLRLSELQQTGEFYRLRAESRKSHDLDAYRAAFGTESEKSWLSEDELRLYKAQKRLQSAPRQWKSPANSSMKKAKPDVKAENKEE